MEKHEALYKDVSSLEVVAYTTRDGDFEDGVTFILEKLDAIPVADVQPVRHGKWERRRANLAYDIYTCSNCGFEQWERNVVGLKWNYCPNCGAKMDAGDGGKYDIY